MSLYLDTSALVKLYVEEKGSPDVARWVAMAAASATSRIAYAEARAAFARRHREGALTAAELRLVVTDLDRDFRRFVVVELVPGISDAAGDLAQRRQLRGFDALHLASALALRAEARSFSTFAAFDRRLSAAAASEGFALPR